MLMVVLISGSATVDLLISDGVGKLMKAPYGHHEIDNIGDFVGVFY